MRLGQRIWTLWKLKTWVAVSAVIALLVAIWSVANISLAPPGLTPRALEMATGTTHIVVDTPRSSVLDLRQNTYDFEALTQRAVLLGNVMANGPVRAAIAKRAGVPVNDLEVAPPLTPQQPRATVGSANQPSVTDIVKSTNQYRLSIEANPTVPVLDIYAQAPTASSAATLANAAVDGLRQYLSSLAAIQHIPSGDRIRILQLGSATGEVINNGVYWQVGLLVFVLTFAAACGTTIILSRIRRGWRMAALSEQRAAG